MKVTYLRTGVAISDFEIDDYILDAYKNNRDIEISNELVILALRCFIKDKIIKKENVELWADDKIICINEHGRLDDFYGNSYHEHYLDKLLDLL